jgi:beta-1,4-N-acetylglucosaminyltransferase
MTMTSQAVLGLVILCLVVLVAYRLWKTLPGLSTKHRHSIRPVDILVVLGSGGHTSEIMPFVGGLSKWKHSGKITVVASTTDSLSLTHPLIPADAVKTSIRRAREVGQSYFTSIFTTLAAFFAALRLLSIKPDLLLVNGPGVCFPVVLSLFLGNFLGLTNCSIVFIESFCRVTTLSVTGKLIYPFCDLFFVNWPELLKFKKRAVLIDQFGLSKYKRD